MAAKSWTKTAFAGGRYRHEYFDQLLAQLKIELGDQDPRYLEIYKLRDDQTRLGLTKVYEAELMLVKSMELSRLPHYLHNLAIRFQQVHEHDLKLPSFNGKPTEANRQYAIEQLSEMYREMTSRRAKEEALSRSIRMLSYVALGLLVSLILSMTSLHFFTPPNVNYIVPPVVFIATAGAIGGILGHLRELIAPRGKVDLYILTFELAESVKSWPYKVLAGVVYSLLFAMIVAAGLLQSQLLQGSIFPKIELKPTDLGLMKVFISRIPTQEFSKLIVWCFVAGFFQPFVPGLLARLVARAPQDRSDDSQKKLHQASNKASG